MDEGAAVQLAAGDLRAEIRPDCGGSLGGFWSQTPAGTTDWMRRARPDAADARGMACYPLVPFSNRIREGRFTFLDREIVLPLNYAPHPHVIHGHGWQAAWQVAERTGHTAVLHYRHAADAWPWTYLAEQRFALDAATLTIAISVTNLDDTPMPAGIGLHPYFPRHPGGRLSASVGGLWRSDDEVMPTDLVPADTVWPAGAPLIADEQPLDNCFTAWGKRLAIDWPGSDRGDARHLSLEASGPLDFLIVFTPPGASFFCAEPVSHCIDAFNLARTRDDTGMVALGPGETLSGEVVFRPGRAR
ncbi:aldose 1-epimerase [Microbaculum marinum]|uniref:Aldose 1-epimerase n=1 Tax=Microbaculum marinum TaxID=1764581 RepID=A0AAW9RVJ3_9HYPH